jgi:hypothetical protein
MIKKLDVIIISVPYIEPVPAVAPVLLSACLNEKNITAKGLDFSIEFYKHFSKKKYWINLKNELTLGSMIPSHFSRRMIIDILKFNKRYLTNLKENYDPKWIGLSIFTSESINYSYLLIYSIRKYLPNTKIIIGGKGIEVKCSMRNRYHYDIYVENGLADLAMVGDCEHTFAKAILENQSGVYISSPQTKEDLDQTPVPNWDEYELDQYLEFSYDMVSEPYMAITASKGCVRKCTFCDVASFWPNYIYRKPENVAEEIIAGYTKTGIKRFLFTDNLINGSVSHYRTINTILANRIPNEISYQGYAIFRSKDTMPAEDFELAKIAGCKNWLIGVESGSERVRFELGKKITDEDIYWSCTHLAKQGITQTWLMMVGYPTETDEDFELTLELFRKYAHIGRKGLIKPSITPTFRLLNNSPIMQDSLLREDLGLTHNLEIENFNGKFWTSTKNPNNTFPVRADRWKKVVSLVQELGYPMSPLMSVVGNDKWMEEVNALEKLYEEKTTKIIPISQI